MSIELKPNARIMQFCDEMYERRSRGHDYPARWMVKTREKLEVAGVVSETGAPGKQYYFICQGLAWYLKNKK